MHRKHLAQRPARKGCAVPAYCHCCCHRVPLPLLRHHSKTWEAHEELAFLRVTFKMATVIFCLLQVCCCSLSILKQSHLSVSCCGSQDRQAGGVTQLPFKKKFHISIDFPVFMLSKRNSPKGPGAFPLLEGWSRSSGHISFP